MDVSRVSAGILAGGKSSRMGTNKLLLEVDGEIMLARVADQCRNYPEKIISVADRSVYQFMDLPDVIWAEDERTEYGPLEGIYQILKASSKEAALVVAGDMPYITADFLEALTERFQQESEDILILKTGDGVHPLCAVYGKQMMGPLLAMLEADEHRVRKLFDQCKVRYITPDEMGFQESVADNMNTPEEYERVKHTRKE